MHHRRRVTPEGLYPAQFCLHPSIHRDRSHLRGFHRFGRFLYHQLGEDARLLRGRILYDHQWICSITERLLRQLIHEQRRGLCCLLRPLLVITSQEFASHRRTILILQRWFGHQLLQSCLQDGAHALRHSGARHQDCQRSIHTHAGQHRNSRYALAN